MGLSVRPIASLYAVVKSSLACRAMPSSTCTFPWITPGGKPVIALPGEIPTSPTILVGPVFVTVEPARTAKRAALRRSTEAVAGTIVDAAPRPGAAGVELPALHAVANAV